MTTAASLWSSAAIGNAEGAGQLVLQLTGDGLAFAVLLTARIGRAVAG